LTNLGRPATSLHHRGEDQKRILVEQKLNRDRIILINSR
jgi:hypothetical protein